MWRTEKHLSLEDYNELSEQYEDLEHLEIIHGYVNNLQKAMSERNVGKLTGGIHKRARDFSQTSGDEDSINDDESQSINMAHPDPESRDEQDVDYHHYETQKQQTHNFDTAEQDLDFDNRRFDPETMSVDKIHRDKRNTCKEKLSTNKTNSVVDIDTVDGKVC